MLGLRRRTAGSRADMPRCSNRGRIEVRAPFRFRLMQLGRESGAGVCAVTIRPYGIYLRRNVRKPASLHELTRPVASLRRASRCARRCVEPRSTSRRRSSSTTGVDSIFQLPREGIQPPNESHVCCHSSALKVWSTNPAGQCVHSRVSVIVTEVFAIVRERLL